MATNETTPAAEALQAEAPTTPATGPPETDAQDLSKFGYKQTLRRGMGLYSSFALSFSMVGITGGIFGLFGSVFTTLGGVGVWLFLVVLAGISTIVLVYAHLAARLPITGYAYQWSSRIVNHHYGWFSGWNALLSFFIGTASLGVVLATVFASDVWKVPTQGDLILFAAVCILAAVVVNVIGIKVAAMVNNVGATTELVGTLGLALVLFIGVFFFTDRQGISVIFQVGAVGGGHINATTIGLAALLPIYLFLGWEGSADLAEETTDPRRAAPTAMMRSVMISGACAIFVFLAFAMAIPHSIADTINRAQNPMIYIFSSHFGAAMGDILSALVFIALFSTLIANTAVATRMCYALSRDKMLPGWQIWSKVNSKTLTPLYAILLVGLIALLVNFLSSAIINQVAAMVNVTYYGTYLLTMFSALWAVKHRTIPDAPRGYFGLGRWFTPLAVIGLCWSALVIIDMTVPTVNHLVGEYTVGGEVVGIIWYFAYLRKRLQRHEAGPPVTA